MSRGPLCFATVFALMLASSSHAQLAPPSSGSTGALRVATSAQIAPTLALEARAFERAHPEIHIAIEARGSDVAMAALYSGGADLAVIGREASEPEIKAFEWVHRHPPGGWPVMRGSLATPGHSPNIAVLVNSANPVRSITLTQLKTLFLSQQTPHWRDLGVSGALGARPITLIMPDATGGTGRFLRHAVFGDATQLAWVRVREVGAPPSADLRDDDIDRRIAAAVAREPTALGLAGATRNTAVRQTPLQVGGAALSIDDPRYPLQRDVLAYADTPPRNEVRLFLDFLSSEEGRRIVQSGPYRPTGSETKTNSGP